MLIEIRQDPESISMIDAARGAFFQTLSKEYLTLALPPFAILLIVNFFMPALAGFLGLFAVSYTTVKWLTYLNFGDVPEYTFGRNEIRYLGWLFGMSVVGMVGISTLMGLFFGIGNTTAMMMGSIILGAFLIFALPYFNIFMALIALGYPYDQSLVYSTIYIVRPIQIQLWMVYVAVAIVMLPFSVVMTNAFFSLIGNVFSFIVLGWSISFSSYILHHRTVLSRPE